MFIRQAFSLDFLLNCGIRGQQYSLSVSVDWGEGIAKYYARKVGKLFSYRVCTAWFYSHCMVNYTPQLLEIKPESLHLNGVNCKLAVFMRGYVVIAALAGFSGKLR